MVYILAFLVVNLLTGCADVQHSTYFITHQYKKNRESIAKDFIEKEPSMIKCFDRSSDMSKNSLELAIAICSGRAVMVFPRRIRGNDMYKLNEMMEQCIRSRYYEMNKEYIKNNLLVSDDRCRTMLFEYMISNEYDTNPDLFEMYHKSMAKWYEKYSPHMIYCFIKDENNLINDINSSSKEATEPLYGKYFQRLPSNEEQQKLHSSMIKEFATKYFDKNKDFFSIEGLTEDQKRTCLEKVKPQIKLLHPNATWPATIH